MARSTGFKLELFGDHLDCSMKVAFSLRGKLIIALTVWDRAAFCYKHQVWRSHVSWITGNISCRRKWLFTIVFTVSFGAWLNEYNTNFLRPRLIPWNSHALMQVDLLFNLPFLCLNWISNIAPRIDWRGSGDCFSSLNQVLRTLISLGNR